MVSYLSNACKLINYHALLGVNFVDPTFKDSFNLAFSNYTIDVYIVAFLFVSGLK